MPDIDAAIWAESQDDAINFNDAGDIIDYIDNSKTRKNTPEERVRQRLVKSLVEEYGYDKSCIGLEIGIKSGAKEVIDIKTNKPGRADIIIYSSAKACSEKNQGQIFAIFETKKEDEITGKNQLVSYISNTNAEGGGWCNGSELEFYRRMDTKSGGWELLSFPIFPRFGESWASVGEQMSKDDLIIPSNLKPVFQRCHHALYSSGITSEDISVDMVRIILAKIGDEKASGEKCKFFCTPEEYNNSEQHKKVAQRVRTLFEEVKQENTDVFDSGEVISASDTEITKVVKFLQNYSFIEADLDVMGTAYEVYVASHLKGDFGQYFTNRLLINLILEIIDPNEKSFVLDPACGSAGFLMSTMLKVFNKIEKSKRSEKAKTLAKEKFKRQLFGMDISKKLVKIARANMIIGGDGHSGIAQGNSLSSYEEMPVLAKQKFGKGVPDIIVTNPPFGSSSKHKIKDENILNHHELAEPKGVPPEILFMERCIDWVKPGGYVGIVMAAGQMDNNKALRMRKYILEKCKIIAMINAHEDSFEPFCGAKAGIFILQKYREGEDRKEDYEIFMAINRKIGQNGRGEPQFARDSQGKYLRVEGRYVIDEDVGKIIDNWRLFKEGQPISYDSCYLVKRSELDEHTLSPNPLKFDPKYMETVRLVRKKKESGFSVKPLKDLVSREIFNGPRFKRPYADEGVTSGEEIIRYYTGTALSQTKGDNVKYLDLKKADKNQRKQIESLRIWKDWILISDSGTVGNIVYAMPHHSGAAATNNLIRVVINDPILRGYVYTILTSKYGQHQLMRLCYGTNQHHIEPADVGEILIPIPDDDTELKAVGEKTIRAMEARAETLALEKESFAGLDGLMNS